MKETQDTQALALGWEDLLEQEMTTHSGIAARKIPWTEEPGGLQSMEWQRDTAEDIHTQYLPLKAWTQLPIFLKPIKV